MLRFVMDEMWRSILSIKIHGYWGEYTLSKKPGGWYTAYTPNTPLVVHGPKCIFGSYKPVSTDFTSHSMVCLSILGLQMCVSVWFCAKYFWQVWRWRKQWKTELVMTINCQRSDVILWICCSLQCIHFISQNRQAKQFLKTSLWRLLQRHAVNMYAYMHTDSGLHYTII